MPASQPRKDKVKATLAATRARRATQACRVVACKVDDSKLNAAQREALRSMRLEAKWVWNESIASGDIFHYKPGRTVRVRRKDDDGEWTVEEREIRFLSAQERQAVADEPRKAALANKAKKDKAIAHGAKPPKTGPIGYRKSADEIPLKQAGVTYRFTSPDTVRVQGIPGVLHLEGADRLDPDHRMGSRSWRKRLELDERLCAILNLDLLPVEHADAKILYKPSGVYLAVTLYEDETQDRARRVARAWASGRRQTQWEAGADAGQTREITMSDGTVIDHRAYEPTRLKVAQRHLSKRAKRTHGWWRAKHILDREHERIAALKDAKAAETVNELYWTIHRLYVQDEQISLWKRTDGRARGSRKIHHGILGRVYGKFRKSPDWVTVCDKWQPTTSWCPHCGRRTKHPPGRETFICQWCHYTMPRDKHAACNMIPLGKHPLTLEQLRLPRSTPIGPHGTGLWATPTAPTPI